ncbi:MAG: carboxypeptidase-like regulatory domain-containing protein [Ignavibacteriae bacterium]|nr:carboxypeptidase-like regulatory domain-containing protein [Ignavibacteriota bacterium]
MKKVFFLLFCISISCLFLLSSCDSNPSETPAYPNGAITGRVLDSATHKPLAGVFINTIPATFGCLTDTSGKYTLTGIPMGTTAINVFIIYSRTKYINDTIVKVIKSDDTLQMEDVRLIPTNGVFVINDLQVQQSDYPESYSNIDLCYIYPVPTIWGMRDVDLRDSLNVKLRFQFRSSHLDLYQAGYITKLGNSLGGFTKSEFDTLTMYYGANEPLTDADFPRDRTNYFYTPLTELSVIPFYLVGRYYQDPNLPKIYGLLYIKSTWLEPSNNRFMVKVDVKINKNGKNYFIPYNK